MFAGRVISQRVGRTNKYRAIPTHVDGIRFASKREAKRYRELRLLEAAGEITALELQPRYPIHAVTGRRVAFYVADFRYVSAVTGETIVEDVKSGPTATPVYKLKKKLVEAEHGIEVVEV